ncbi:MAG: carboxypeptidase regulatory-like domain-containing protein [Acidobacteriia bacterium]|nr:carboxypeptidase regulatory-like domain-containing protein [Terriglobia bacterium]
MAITLNAAKKMLMTVLLVTLLAALSLAQSTTDGAIGGTVTDSNGAVVSNAKVVIHNNGTNAEVTSSTDPTGYFRVGHLQPGNYTVSVSEKGFATYRAEQVVVQVGSITDISPKLAVGGVAETVEVGAEAPQINYTTPEFAPTLNQTAISNLPINGGRWSNFSLLTPGVVSDSNAFGLLSFRGVSILLNNNTVDGADNNQAFFSEERGRTRAGYSTPKVAIQEFQVNTSNYSAEYGRSAGGVINTVTKSGTNKIHGEAYFYDRDNVWGAANRFTQVAVQTAPGVFTSTNFKPTDWRKIAGFGIGGPLIKDKLFWFLSYDWFKHNFPGTAVTSNPGAFFAAPTAGTITTLATRLGVSTAQATTIYNNDLAGLNTMLGLVPRTGDQNIILPKLDWVINSKNHASFSFNRMRWSSPAGIQTASTVTRGVASFGDDFVKDTWGVAKLVTLFTSNLANEIRFQYGRDFEYEFSQAPSPYELANLVNAPTFTNPLKLPPTVSITNGFTFGVPNFLQRPNFPDETRMQVADTVNWTHGKHTIKFGLDFSHINDNSQNLFNGFGSYSYSTLLNYFSDLNLPNTCAGKPCYTSFSQGLGLPGVEFQTNDYAWFIADDWKIHPRLSLSLGLRWEYEQLPSPFSSLVNPLAPQTGKLPSDTNNYGPRVGFSWDVFGEGKTVLRGGYGIYYGRLINSTIFSALTSTGTPGSQVSLSFTPTSAGAPVFPAILTSLSGVGRNIVYFDPNFQNPQIHQTDLTMEQDLGWGTVLSVSYLGSMGRQLPDFVDTNVPLNNIGTITYRVTNGGPLGTGNYTTALFKGARPNTNFASMTDVISGVNSSYNALAVQVNHRMSHNIQFSASYTWAHAIDFGQNQQTFSATNLLLFPNSIGPEKGNSQYDVPNRFVLHAVMTSPWKKQGWAGWLANGWEFDPVYQIQNGLPYTLSVSGNAPGGAISGINGSGGSNRIDVLGNNSFRQPMTWLTDIRVAKYFNVGAGERYKIELLADFFNIANKQNVMGVNNTGYIIQSSGTVTTPTGPVPCSAALPCMNFNVSNTFAPLFGSVTSVNNSNFLYTPRQIQLGARIHF